MFGNIMMFIKLFEKLFPIVHGVVQMVEATAPSTVKGAEKFDAAMTAVQQAITVAPTAVASVAAVAVSAHAGDQKALTESIGHMIELSVSLSKTFGLFPKAEIVQKAKPLAELLGSSNDAPGA